MKLISSQHYLNDKIVDKKIDMIVTNGLECVKLPIVNLGIEDLDGEPLYALVDGHHTRYAAEICEIEVEYYEIDDFTDSDPGLARLEAYNQNDGEWYYVETGASVW